MCSTTLASTVVTLMCSQCLQATFSKTALLPSLQLAGAGAAVMLQRIAAGSSMTT